MTGPALVSAAGRFVENPDVSGQKLERVSVPTVIFAAGL
jgi:hypothetical protein